MARSSGGRSRGGKGKKNNRAAAAAKNANANATAAANAAAHSQASQAASAAAILQNPTIPSATLDAILKDLKLTYNSNTDTLSGDTAKNVPRVDLLNNFKKALSLLKTQLDKSLNEDQKLLEKIDAKLNSLNPDEEEEEEKEEQTQDDENKDIEMTEDTKKRRRSETTRDGDLSGEDEKKGHKDKQEDDDDQDEDDDDDDDEPLKPVKKRSKIKQEVIEPIGEDARDEDDIPLAAVRNTAISTGQVDKMIETEEAKLANGTTKKQHRDDDEEEDEEDDDEEENEEEEEDEDDDENEDEEEEGDEQYHTPDGNVIDTRVKNPKSEFVTSQTLPAAAAALGLFSEETGGLDQTGELYLKKKFAVASYPTRDLKDMLPGDIPNVDFSKSKPSNQVQFTTFQGYTDVFFRPYSEDDIKFMKEKYTVCSALGKHYDPALHPYLIPKLGPLYSDTWPQEEPLNGVKLSTPSQPHVSAESVMPKGSGNQLTDEFLESESISCGPLVTRLLSALISDRGDEIEDNDENNNNTNGEYNNEGNDEEKQHEKEKQQQQQQQQQTSSSSALEDQQGWNAPIVKADYSELEQRLRRELKYVGVYMNVDQTLKAKQAALTGISATATAAAAASGGASANGTSAGNGNGNGTSTGSNGTGAAANAATSDTTKDEFQEDWITGKEDDEICAEMRYLQRELNQITRKNMMSKQRLIPIIEEQIAWQEYISILDDLDKQIDQAYLKRMRVPKKAKKRGHGAGAGAGPAGQPQQTPSALAAQQAQQAQQAAANSGLKALLDKRARWMNKIGPLFKSMELMRRMPQESVFKDVDMNKIGNGTGGDDDLDNEELEDDALGMNKNNGNGASANGTSTGAGVGSETLMNEENTT